MADETTPPVPPPPPPLSSYSPTVPLSQPEGPSPKRTRRGLVVGLIVVVALALISAGVALGLNAGSKSPSASAPRMGVLMATAKSPVDVVLTWTSTAGSQVQYSISRDGKYLNEISGTGHSYADETVKPKTSYTYAVSVVQPSGRHSPPARATVTTPAPPPIGAARLNGRFGVRETFVSENFTNAHVGQVVKEQWAFFATCATGACSVRLKLYRRGWRKTKLRRKGASYSGKGTDMLGRCASTHVQQTLTIGIHVTRARYILGVWTATRFTGTVATYSAPGFGCIGGEATQAVTGRPI